MTTLDTYRNQAVLRGLDIFVWKSDVTSRHVHWNGTSEFISYYHVRVIRAVIRAIYVWQISYYPSLFKCCPVFLAIYKGVLISP